MSLHSKETNTLHKDIYQKYKDRLEVVENASTEEKEEPFERSFLHNAIYLHRLWFEQLDTASESDHSPLLDSILQKRGSSLSIFKEWMNEFAKDAKPYGWSIWGWSHTLKTFVGFPIKEHSNAIPLSVSPLLVIDCWEHAWFRDYDLNFDDYLTTFWNELNWDAIEKRHHELATLYGYGVK